MRKLTALPLIISACGMLFANPSMAITSSQMQMRVSAVCGSHANISRIANPDVIYEMCLNGARESMQGRNSVCEKKIRKFSELAQTLHGMERAEYIEIAQAYRAGCNAGKQSPKANGESKSARVTTLSPQEIKQREEIQSYGTEVRNAFSRIREGAFNLTGKKCSVNVWLSQKGEVLSTKVESGDEDACSFVLRKTKGMKLSPMSDSQYQIFRNIPISIGF